MEWARCWRVVVEPRDGRPGSGLAVSRSLGDLDFKVGTVLGMHVPKCMCASWGPRIQARRARFYVHVCVSGIWASRCTCMYVCVCHGRSTG